MAFRLKKIEAARVSYSFFKAGNNLFSGNGSADPSEHVRLVTKNINSFLLQSPSIYEINNSRIPNFAYNKYPAIGHSPIFSSVSLKRSYYAYCSPPSDKILPERNNCKDLSSSVDTQNNKKSNDNLPSPDKLQRVHDTLLDNLPKIFIQHPDYSIYHKDIIFENRIRNATTVGLSSYALQISLLKFIGHIKFSYIKFHILDISKRQEEGTVTIRWRIKGLTTLQALVQFFKSKRWGVSYDKSATDLTNWYDGYSTFFVNGEGVVTRHVVDNVLKDDGVVEEKSPFGLAKVALVLGFLLGDNDEYLV